MTIRLKAMFLALFVLGMPSATICEEYTTPRLPPRVKQMLDWLPVDTETLFVVNGPFQIPRKASEIPAFQELLQSMSVGLVAELQDGLFRKQLQGHEVLIAIEGSRRFKSPKGLGLMPFEGCQMLLFDDSSDGALKSALKLCLEKADETIRLSDVDVAIFNEKWEADKWLLFVTRPRRGVLLCATDRGFLEQVLARMKQEHQDRALPEQLPEWRHVSTTAKAWAIRHYRKETADQDPSSPLRAAAAANVLDPHAIGFVFWYDAKQGKVAKARYLSGTMNTVPLVTKGWRFPSMNLIPKIEEIQPGVVEISVSIEKDRVGHCFVLVLLGYLGHGVYL
ncbi:MAG: hypothetical protein K8R46_02480 [Pirellulales bacterium]|nr:hypothetical protein [Pirellulales bacterium]